MSQEEIKKKDSNKKRYVYLNKFTEHKEEMERRFELIDKELQASFDRLIGFTIIIGIVVIVAIIYSNIN